MSLFRRIMLIWNFYKNFGGISFLINLFGISIFWKFGYSSFAPLFYFKVLTLGIILYYINKYKYKEYYYYENLGLSIKTAWVITIIIDLSLFILLITQIYRFK